MISTIENATLLCVSSKKWKMEDKGTSGTSYQAVIYSNKEVLNCKTDEELYNLHKDSELVKGTAVIAVRETTYGDKKSVVYLLMKFGENKK